MQRYRQKMIWRLYLQAYHCNMMVLRRLMVWVTNPAYVFGMQGFTVHGDQNAVEP